VREESEVGGGVMEEQREREREREKGRGRANKKGSKHVMTL
jgi:hypothetical protein